MSKKSRNKSKDKSKDRPHDDEAEHVKRRDRKKPDGTMETSAASHDVGTESSSADAGLSADAVKLARKAAKQARRAEEAAAKAAAKEARRAEKQAREAADAATGPKFKHVRKKRLESGKGPTPIEIGQSLVSLFNAGRSDEAESTWYHRKIESIEDDGQVFEGMKGVVEKGRWWKANFTVLSMQAQGPYACATGFAVVFSGRLRTRDGSEIDAHEIGVYDVEDGRIVREQFMRWSPGGA